MVLWTTTLLIYNRLTLVSAPDALLQCPILQLHSEESVNLSKVRLNYALRCGESVTFTESRAQSDRASLWLWSVANNPNSSKSGVQDYRPLLTTHP